MAQNKHKWRANVYLGKELYEDIERYADMLGLSVAAMCKVLLHTGFQIAKLTEEKEVNNYGKQ